MRKRVASAWQSEPARESQQVNGAFMSRFRILREEKRAQRASVEHRVDLLLVPDQGVDLVVVQQVADFKGLEIRFR